MWWASPSAHRPEILVPADSPAAARTAVRRYHDGFTARRRLRSLLAEGLTAARPLTGPVLRAKLVGVSAIDGPATDAGVSRGVIDGIRDLLAVPDLVVAIGLSTPKSNQKPVLQLLDGDGRCHGWAKVAWNDRTNALVGNEADWARRSGRPPLIVPRLLHDEEVAGRRVVIISGVSPRRRPQRRPDALPDPAVFLAVAALGSDRSVEITDSPWWRSVEAGLGDATDRERQAVRAARESCVGLRFRIGAWHGDLTPWNLMTTRGGVQLIDWEFAADGVPIGFDLCHFHTQVAAELKGRDASAALDRSARLSPQGLAALGVESANITALWRLYLVELVRRQVTLRAGGFPADRLTAGPAALTRLERVLGLAGAVGPGEAAPIQMAVSSR